MNVNEAISKLRVMLGANTELVAVQNAEEKIEESVEIKAAEATLVDGTEVYTEGELQPGAILFVRSGDGASDDAFAPEGKHETSTGMIITVGESGEITNVEETDGAEETVTEEEETFEEEDKKEEKAFDAEELLEGVASLLAPYTEEIKSLKEELSVLTSRFNDVADEPAATKVRNTFSQEAQTKASLAEARFERLVSLRKTK